MTSMLNRQLSGGTSATPAEFLAFTDESIDDQRTGIDSSLNGWLVGWLAGWGFRHFQHK